MRGVLIAAAMLLIWPHLAHAEMVDLWGHPRYQAPGEARAYHKRHKPRAVKRRGPEVRAYVKREDEDRLVCLDRVRVVGSQWANENGAEDSARKAWMEQVRWRFGESAMTIEAAQDYSKRCSRSSIGEFANQIFYRCEVQAKPCRPVFQSK